MTTGYPRVSALKRFRSSGRCQGRALFRPITPLRATATSRDTIGLFTARGGRETPGIIMSAMKVALDFPQRYYPRSFLKLLLFAFGAVVLPLIVAFVNAAVYVDRLAGQSQSAVAQAAQ